MKIGGQTNSHSQFIHCSESLPVLLHRKESKRGWGADRVSSNVHKVACLIVSHAHKTVLAPTFVKVYQKES